ncbi:MAG: hypothetical protein J5720_05630 [Bacteroidaceae bacterium]|nr:hypothetical protein [Bacteroidaceae bacterium]
MAKKCNRLVNKTILQVLTFLGIGSASFLFMACYGPAPQYGSVDYEDVDSLALDSLDENSADTLYEADIQNPE